MAKRKYKTMEETFDAETGEHKVTKHFVIVDKSTDTDYIKLYKACTRSVLKDLQGHESIKLKVLWWFLDQLQDKPYGKLQIYASTEELAHHLHCSDIAIKKARAFLIKEKYIFRYVEPGTKKVSKNYYILNPEYVHKGRDII